MGFCADHLRGQVARRHLAGVQGARAGGLSGAEPGDCARGRGRRRRRLWPQIRQRGRLLHERLRSLYRPSALPCDASTGDSDHEFTRTPVRRGTSPPQNHPNAFGERAVLKLMFGALIRAAERWRSIKVTEFEHRQIAAVKKELDQEYEAQVGLKAKTSKDAAQVKISSSPRT
jgi:hypothetical protein